MAVASRQLGFDAGEFASRLQCNDVGQVVGVSDEWLVSYREVAVFPQISSDHKDGLELFSLRW